MPISREEFVTGRVDLSYPIMELFSQTPSSAYTATEIKERLEHNIRRIATVIETTHVLDSLVTQRVLTVKVVAGHRYYIMILPSGQSA